VESALLDAGFQVVMYDLRGHGQSAKPHDPGCYSMDAHAGDVQAWSATWHWTIRQWPATRSAR